MKMQTHYMSLLKSPFERMQSGQKTVEIRLNDPKRQRLKLGDKIIFSKLDDLEQKLQAKVVKLLKFRTFAELLEQVPMQKFGYAPEHDKTLMLNSIYTIYSKQQEQEHGILAIELEFNCS